MPDAIKKANEVARRKLIHIPLREGRTIHHDVKAKDGSGRIVLRAASKGTGIIAGGPVRAVCEVLGVKDIVAKSMELRMHIMLLELLWKLYLNKIHQNKFQQSEIKKFLK